MEVDCLGRFERFFLNLEEMFECKGLEDECGEEGDCDCKAFEKSSVS